MWTLVIFAPAPVLFAQATGGRFDGHWTTHLACEARGETPAYKFASPGVIKDSKFHGVHRQEGGPGSLVLDGSIAEDGGARLKATGTVTQSHAHGVFAIKGNHYDYNIKAQFTGTKGTGRRDEGVGILGRPCTFEFDKQTDAAAAPPPAQ
jgi:hypothetical protein